MNTIKNLEDLFKGYVTEEGESIPDEFKENISGRLIK